MICCLSIKWKSTIQYTASEKCGIFSNNIFFLKMRITIIISISNNNKIAGRYRLSGNPPKFRIQIWDVNLPDTYNIVAMGAQCSIHTIQSSAR